MVPTHKMSATTPRAITGTSLTSSSSSPLSGIERPSSNNPLLLNTLAAIRTGIKPIRRSHLRLGRKNGSPSFNTPNHITANTRRAPHRRKRHTKKTRGAQAREQPPTHAPHTAATSKRLRARRQLPAHYKATTLTVGHVTRAYGPRDEPHQQPRHQPAGTRPRQHPSTRSRPSPAKNHRQQRQHARQQPLPHQEPRQSNRPCRHGSPSRPPTDEPD